MSGIDYVVDKRGRKTAVVIDLKRHRRLWEDFQDAMLAQKRKHEPRESLEAVRSILLRRQKFSA